jgi:hypothetical protein
MKVFLCVLLFSFSLICNAQLGWTKQQLINTKGWPTSVVDIADGETKITYLFTTPKQDGSLAHIYFMNKEGQSRAMTCMYNLDDINTLVQAYNSMGYVKIGELKWKDYKTNMVFKIWKDKVYCFSGMNYDD